MHILRATAQSSMLTQGMTDGIDHILRPFISRNWPYPAAIHILQLSISVAIQILHMPMRSTRSLSVPSKHASHSYRPLDNRRGPSSNPGFNMPTRQLITAHSTASNHSSTPPKQLTSRHSKGKHQRLVGFPSNVAHLPALGKGCTGKRPHHPVFTSVAGQYSLFVIGRFTNFRYWESLTRLLDYKVFINLRDLRFCLEKSVTYLKELNIASQYRKFVSQRCFQAVEVAQFAPIRCSTTYGTTLPP